MDRIKKIGWIVGSSLHDPRVETALNPGVAELLGVEYTLPEIALAAFTVALHEMSEKVLPGSVLHVAQTIGRSMGVALHPELTSEQQVERIVEIAGRTYLELHGLQPTPTWFTNINSALSDAMHLPLPSDNGMGQIGQATCTLAVQTAVAMKVGEDEATAFVENTLTPLVHTFERAENRPQRDASFDNLFLALRDWLSSKDTAGVINTMMLPFQRAVAIFI